VPPSLNTHCSTIQRYSMKQCGTKIITRKIVCDIPSPSYNGLCFDLKGFTLIHHKFLF
jgi:hypothetical protein